MSALKTWILFVGVAFLFAACSDDSNPSKVEPENSADAGSSGSGSTAENGSAGSVKGETVVKPGDKIVINGGKDTIVVADAEGSLYYSSGIFCWTEGCEKKFASASSKSSASAKSSSSKGKTSSSSAKATVPSSSSVAVPPTVTDKDMTDNRDKNKYKIEKIGGVTWMAENLRYKPSSGTYCDATVKVAKAGSEDETENVNVCDHYGMFYTSQTAASSACPSGWRLPTKEEVVSALAAQPAKWWTLGGRFDLESSTKYDINMADKEGRIWMQTASDGNNCAQLMNYSGGEKIEAKYLSAGANKRALNVRCVMTK